MTGALLDSYAPGEKVTPLTDRFSDSAKIIE